jgi:DNA polymerase III epsilon subunit-like protein
MDNYEFLVVDTETTSIDDPKVVEVGIIDIDLMTIIKDDLSSLNIIQDLINPKVDITYSAMSVHDITNEMVISKPEFMSTKSYELLSNSDTTNNSILVGHNISFDLKSLRNSSDLVLEHEYHKRMLWQTREEQQAQQAQFEANRNQGTRGKSGGGGNYQKKSNNFGDFSDDVI